MEAHSAEDGVLVGRYPTRREATSALWTYLRTGQRVAPSPPKPTAAARRKARLILEGVLDSKGTRPALAFARNATATTAIPTFVANTGSSATAPRKHVQYLENRDRSGTTLRLR